MLATQTLSNFSNGIYLDWSVSGNVLITITRLAGPSAVLSGLFIDAPPTVVTPIRQDNSTQGNWIGAYGAQGYYIPGLPASLPSYATITSSVASSVWAYGSVDAEAFEEPGSTARMASGWTSGSSIVLQVNLADNQPHDLALYLLNWKDGGVNELVQVANANTGAILVDQTVSDFAKGVYIQWVVTGNATITISQLSDNGAMASALFLDPPSALPPQPSTASATLVKDDTTTEGNWIGTYGSDGYDIAGAPQVCRATQPSSFQTRRHRPRP